MNWNKYQHFYEKCRFHKKIPLAISMFGFRLIICKCVDEPFSVVSGLVPDTNEPLTAPEDTQQTGKKQRHICCS